MPDKILGTPQSVYNGALSGQRNMFLSSSIALVVAAFSDRFESKPAELVVNILAFLIFCLSIFIGYTSRDAFRFYLDTVKDRLPDYVPVKKWYAMDNAVNLYTLLIAILGGLYFTQKIMYAI